MATEPEEAALRELREEAGYTGRIMAHVGALDLASGSEFVRVRYFLVVVPSDAQRLASEDREQRWCSVAEATPLLSFGDARALLMKAIDLL